jgi:hypothetical protein
MKKKYPRTPHLPWSLGATSDDKTLNSVSHFIGKRVIVTEKMDGENFTLGHSYCHARSLDSPNHPSQCWIKAFHAAIKNDIPENVRICGEYMFARHSISYANLKSYFYAFAVVENDVFLNWQITQEWLTIFDIRSVPVLYSGIFDEKKIKECWDNKCGREGYVVRLADGFAYEEFGRSVAKFVRPNHVQTDEHWRENWSKNSLEGS